MLDHTIDHNDLCPRCGGNAGIGRWPFCPHGVPSLVCVGDSIPGGMWIENLSREPQKFYSKTDFKRAQEKAGVRNEVRHVGVPGSDKSPHTQRFV